MGDKNLEIIKHIQQTGQCPEDDIMATSKNYYSDYQPKSNKKFERKTSIKTTPPYIRHLENDVMWYRKRMKEYRESFFKVCDIVEHSDSPEIIKRLVKEELDRY